MTYLDNAATTKIDERVLKAMLPYLGESFGNASSFHKVGRTARTAIDKARARIALLLHCKPREIIFTSGATEANNLFVFGAAKLAPEKKHIVISSVEHHSILEPVEELENNGYTVDVIPVNKLGHIDVEAVVDAVQVDTAFVSIMMVNNEMGAVQPIEQIAKRIKKQNPDTLVHTDAVQAYGYMDCSVDYLGVDALTISSHKVHGPKGVGALYLKDTVALPPLVRGGAQERSLRAGTENVAGIVGFGVASIIIRKDGSGYSQTVDDLRIQLKHGIEKKLKELVKIITPEDAAPHILGILIPGIDRDALLVKLDELDIAASGGSACTTGALEPSHVIEALGYSEEESNSFIRFSLSKHTTDKDIKKTVKALRKCLEGMKKKKG
ncbi:MAG: cysteine desulfurase [Candidatus Jacksonbacteria bacterium]|jgi:cysteine desulfurase|nr:cysteine desulfurase [Candidatus Jacksonbacteria bacterium]MBT6034465.1 cysteine desulfurase [Candidatus Jacksonbacteria bacterium]MBT6301582.1 cysteine desulfurase [Candidatus Jacksonbacteria bacterium]MBT6757000.1 cysteine desulfurase [Candidatus Jacksonbacteria bacterium]MBT6954930.1 cysteine desulfurase [Candidatus Jacksonbacteria bacterium]